VKKIAIIGGGISGLAAAFYLEKARREGAELEYHLFEASSRLGGTLYSERRDDFLLELGADSFLTEKPWARELAREVGIADQIIGSNDQTRQTYVLLDGKLRPLPPGLQFIVPASAEAQQSEFFSDAAWAQFQHERQLPPPSRSHDEDESVASFVVRHFGEEVLENLAAPMLAGVYGGEPEQLSARAVMPKLVEAEAAHGSLSRAFADRPAAPSGQTIFSTFRGGMQQLVEAVAKQIPGRAIHLNCAVKSVSRESAGWKVAVGQSTQVFDAIILAVPAYAAVELLNPVPPSEAHRRGRSRGAMPLFDLAEMLGKIPYSSSATVSLGYTGTAAAQVNKIHPRGFGFLVPRRERRRLMACTFVHQKFPHRAPDGAVLLRAFFGGARDEAAVSLSDSDLSALGQKELREILEIETNPAFLRVHRWPRAMPQYEVRHLSLVQQIEETCAALPGLYLAGNAYHGVGVPDCIRSGQLAAENAIKT
jgi:oxygen-dependent protoporphyrinogen oxidase